MGLYSRINIRTKAQRSLGVINPDYRRAGIDKGNRSENEVYWNHRQEVI